MSEKKKNMKLWWKKNKKKVLIGGAVSLAIVGGVLVTYKLMESEDQANPSVPLLDSDNSKEETKAILKETMRDENRALWEAGNYQENYDKVSAFVKDLKFAPGEQWILEDVSISTDQPYTGEGWIAEHLVNNQGIYPPDEID